VNIGTGTITAVGKGAFNFFLDSPNFVRETSQRCHSAGFSSPLPPGPKWRVRSSSWSTTAGMPRLPAEGVGAANGPRQLGREPRALPRKRPPGDDSGSTVPA
jgi:hypothetical protein